MYYLDTGCKIMPLPKPSFRLQTYKPVCYYYIYIRDPGGS